MSGMCLSVRLVAILLHTFRYHRKKIQNSNWDYFRVRYKALSNMAILLNLAHAPG